MPYVDADQIYGGFLTFPRNVFCRLCLWLFQILRIFHHAILWLYQCNGTNGHYVYFENSKCRFFRDFLRKCAYLCRMDRDYQDSERLYNIFRRLLFFWKVFLSLYLRIEFRKFQGRLHILVHQFRRKFLKIHHSFFSSAFQRPLFTFLFGLFFQKFFNLINVICKRVPLFAFQL